MFDDILKPKLEEMDISEYEEESIYDDTRKCDDNCNCDDCLTEAIKNLADQLKIDLDDDALEDIKIEYLDKHNDPTMKIGKGE